MRIWIFFFYLLIGLACQQKTNIQASKEITYNCLLIDSLNVLNLSEDMSPVSSQQDEIYWCLQLFEQKNGQLHQLQTKSAKQALAFTSNKNVHSIGDTLLIENSLADSLIVLISLLELDEDALDQSMFKRLQNHLSKGTFLSSPQNMHLDSLAGYDDFLGYDYFRLKKAGRIKKRTLDFRGMQLFDRYHYRLSLRPAFCGASAD